MPRTTTSPPPVEFTKISPNRSARTDAIKAIVIHSTEGKNYAGLKDLKGLGDWFANPAAQASSHIATDGDGFTARFVPDNEKAWHAGRYNSQTIGIEQVGFAAQTEWPTQQLKETARWVAYYSLRYNIPIRKGYAFGGKIMRRGVLRHSELGSLGGGHVDPGKGYPMKRMLDYARWYAEHGWIVP